MANQIQITNDRMRDDAVLREIVDEGFFELDEQVGTHGVPAGAHDVETGDQRKMDHRLVAVEALEAHVLVAVVFGPLGLGLDKLAADAFAAEIGVAAGEPVVENGGLELEADGEAHGAVVEAGEHDEDVVAALEAAAEVVLGFRWTEYLIVKLHDHGKLLFGDDGDIGLCHGVPAYIFQFETATV